MDSPEPDDGFLPPDEALRRLERVLRDRAAEFDEVGGDVGLYVKGAKPEHWHISRVGPEVVIRPGQAPFPVVRIGIASRSLSYLVKGDLLVERAFRNRYLMVDGDREAFARFVACFAVKPEDTPAQ